MSDSVAPEKLVADAIAAFPEVKRITLFGSRARGDNRPRSDIDLAVEAPGANGMRWLDIVDAAEDAPTLLTLDLVRLDETTPDLVREIRREGRILYERRDGKEKA